MQKWVETEPELRVKVEHYLSFLFLPCCVEKTKHLIESLFIAEINSCSYDLDLCHSKGKVHLQEQGQFIDSLDFVWVT